MLPIHTAWVPLWNVSRLDQKRTVMLCVVPVKDTRTCREPSLFERGELFVKVF